MKFIKNAALSLLASIALFSCQKENLPENESSASEAIAAVTATQAPIQWTAYTEWNQMKQENFALNYTIIEDAAITSDIADHGLVLVYKKDEVSGTALQLPLEEKASNINNYWYYQVMEGQILLSCDMYGSNDQTIQNSNFKYVTITNEVLAQLNMEGVTKEVLMKSSYSDVQTMLAKM